MKRNRRFIIAVILSLMLTLSFTLAASAQVTDFVRGNLAGEAFEYNYTALISSYTNYVINGNASGSGTELYDHFITKAPTVAVLDDVKGYIDFSDILTAYTNAVIGGDNTWTMANYINSGTGAAANMPATVQCVTVNESNSIVLTAKNIGVTAPTASAVSFNEVAQTIATDNSITVAVDPNATYSKASVTLSQNAMVTVTSGEISKTALFQAGTISDATLITQITNKTSATGSELIAKSPITITLQAVDAQNQPISGVQTVYTVNFQAQQ